MDFQRATENQHRQRVVGKSPLLSTLYGEAAAGYGEDYYVFRVRKLENGYTFNSHGWIAKFVPDIPAILREVALTIGGPEAVPVDQVSPEEAGLLDEPEFSFSKDGPDAEVHKMVEYYRQYIEQNYSIPGFSIQGRIDRVFQVFGYADYHDYKTRKVGSPDEDNKILAVLLTLVQRPDSEPVNTEERKTDA